MKSLVTVYVRILSFAAAAILTAVTFGIHAVDRSVLGAPVDHAVLAAATPATPATAHAQLVLAQSRR